MTGVDTELLASVLRRAAERGATAADGFLVEDTSFSASVRLGQVDTVTHSREQRLSLRVFAGRASAAASTSDLSRASLERVVDEATALARVTAEDPHAGLPDPVELIDHVPDLALDDREAAVLVERAEALADRAPPAPRSKGPGGELHPLVGDQMTGPGADPAHHDGPPGCLTPDPGGWRPRDGPRAPPAHGARRRA